MPRDHHADALAQTQPGLLPRAAVVYCWLCALSVASLIIADIVGIKLFSFSLPFTLPIVNKPALEHTCGMLTFPVTFILTDLLNEYYGKKAARRVAIISFAAALFCFVVINIALAMPYLQAPFNISRQAFEAVFQSSRVMYVASLAAYLIGNLCDIAIFGQLKKLTGGKMVWLRATGSTVASQLIDSFIVTYLAFSLGRRLDPSGPAPMTMAEVFATALTGYTLKFLIAVGVTPLIYAGRAFMKRVLGLTPLPAES